MRTRASLAACLRMACLLALVASATRSTAAPTSLGELLLLPQTVPAGKSTIVKVIVAIDDPSYIPNSAYLYRINDQGRVGARLGVFKDDGTLGDLVANDRRLTAQFAVSEQNGTSFDVVASAAFRGSLQRVFSPTALVSASSLIADVNGPKAAVMTDHVVFLDQSGQTQKSVSLAPKIEGSDPNDQTETNYFALVSPDQSVVGIFASTDRIPTELEEQSEGDTLSSTFSLYAAGGTKVWEESSPQGMKFSLPSINRDLFSESGGRVLLVSNGLEREIASIAVFDIGGALVYRSRETFLGVTHQTISPNGKLVGAIVTRRTTDSFEVLFHVVEADSGLITERLLSAGLDSAFRIRPSVSGGLILFIREEPAMMLP